MELSEIQEIFCRDQDESDCFILPAARQSQIAGLQKGWNTLTSAAIEVAALVEMENDQISVLTWLEGLQNQKCRIGIHGPKFSQKP